MSISRVTDHPVIGNMERTGHPNGKEPEYPICPICGAECDEVYLGKDDDVVGCMECIKPANAWERGECFPEEN